MTDYQAPKPIRTKKQLAQAVLPRIFFPPILLWDLLKIAVNKIAGEKVSKLVLPALDMPFLGMKINNVSTFNNATLHFEKYQVITHDGAVLDTLEITHSAQDAVYPSLKNYIINFPGNAMCYEQTLKAMNDDALALKCNVIGFNFRGVNQSTGKPKSKDDLVIDGIAQVQRLLDQGVSPENITLKGYSLGASIATLITHHFHQQGIKINLFNDRSFSSITNFLVGHIRTGGNETGHLESTGMKILGWIAKPFVKLGLLLTQWEINAGNAYKAIPAEYKDYMVVRTRKNARNKDIYDDSVIPHYASIHAALKDERRAQKANIDKLIVAADKEKRHGEPLAKPDLEEAGNNLRNARAQFKARKMEVGVAEVNGHLVPQKDLHNRAGKDGVSFFREFVNRAHKDHGVSLSRRPLFSV